MTNLPKLELLFQCKEYTNIKTTCIELKTSIILLFAVNSQYEYQGIWNIF